MGAENAGLLPLVASEQVVLNPSDFGEEATGHFGLFHSRHASGFWIDTVLWLRDGINPWPQNRVSSVMTWSVAEPY